MENKAKNQLLRLLFTLVALLLAFTCEVSSADVKTAVYLSPEIILNPGSVLNQLFYNIPFPKGHIGVKSFNGELVDESGTPVPLLDTYIHHWAVFRYYYRTNNTILVRNGGVCPDPLLGQYFGMQSEGRKMNTYVPEPYAIEVGTPGNIPSGYNEGWILNVHALDARGVVDKVGCRECRCKLYNVSKDEAGKPLPAGYEGGFHCCYNQTQCELKKGVEDLAKRMFFRYTVKWVDWDQTSVLPVRLYILDVTDAVQSATAKHNCKTEYEVMPCKTSSSGCTDTRRTKIDIPKGGYIVYGVALQYSGGTGVALYKQDGSTICASIPIYGSGKEAANEDGYIVGMSTCYPRPGSVKILDGETLSLESNYNSSQKHTGAAGFIKILVADQLPTQNVISGSD